MNNLNSGEKVGYIRLKQFNAKAPKEMRIAITQVDHYTLETGDPKKDKKYKKEKEEGQRKNIKEIRDKDMKRRIDSAPELNDFYNE